MFDYGAFLFGCFLIAWFASGFPAVRRLDDRAAAIVRELRSRKAAAPRREG